MNDPFSPLSLLHQLADDLSWLEEYYRRGELAPEAGRVRLAAALVRNCLGPFLEGQPPVPLHVAVVGGAGAGKSTLANLLTGSQLAETNPQAGFTRHPIAYTSAAPQAAWRETPGFLGPLRRLNRPAPANLDEDVYQVRQLPPADAAPRLSADYVVWDCPDMTTWAARGYLLRLLEVAALADIVVYVASDERYNDQVPTEFLHLLLRAGKAVVVCLVKMREEEVPALLEQFRRQVLSQLSVPPVACLAVPYLSPAQLADWPRQVQRYQFPLLHQVQVLGTPPTAARQRTVRAAGKYLLAAQEEFLGPARQDLLVLQDWKALVEQGRGEFERRYYWEYLSQERFPRFDEALVRLLELLELPGIGRVLGTALYVLRTPYRLLRGLLAQTFQQPPPPERPVLEQALDAWLDLLHKEATRRSSEHPLWRYVHQGFSSGGLAEQARQRFAQQFQLFQQNLSDEAERTARAIYEDLEKNPLALNTLRGTKLAFEVAAIGGTLAAGGIHWSDVLLVPLAASVVDHLVQVLGKQYVDAQRQRARARQEELAREYVSLPLARWLSDWPTSGDSPYERLRQVLTRIPANLRSLQQTIEGCASPA
jgi:hypothetical protein